MMLCPLDHKCPACKGSGCSNCHGTGYEPCPRSYATQWYTPQPDWRNVFKPVADEPPVVVKRISLWQRIRNWVRRVTVTPAGKGEE